MATRVPDASRAAPGHGGTGEQAGDDGGRGQELVRRGMAAAGLCGIALIHILDLREKYHENQLIAFSYLPLIAAALVMAELMIRCGTPWRWAATAAVALGPLAGYLLSRTTGLPGSREEIGHWNDPLGTASLFVEATVIVLAVLASRSSRWRRPGR